MWCIVHVLHRKLMMQQRVVQQPAFLISTDTDRAVPRYLGTADVIELLPLSLSL